MEIIAGFLILILIPVAIIENYSRRTPRVYPSKNITKEDAFVINVENAMKDKDKFKYPITTLFGLILFILLIILGA